MSLSPRALLPNSRPAAEGVRQDEQGERYQFGPKAATHFNNARTAYQAASSIDPSSFDAAFNAARVEAHLAMDQLPAPTCCAMMESAIAGYRRALALREGEGAERIDAAFNLAQGLVAMGEMLEEGAVVVEDSLMESLGWEAQSLFGEVEGMQRREMERVGLGTRGGAVDDEGMDEGEEGASDAGATAGPATEGSIVTPSLVLDTLLESISNDLVLDSHFSSSSPTSSFLPHLASHATSSLERAQALAPLIPNFAPLDLTLATLSLSSTLSLPPLGLSLSDSYLSLLSTHPSDLSLLSTTADHLVETASSLPPIAQALELYTTAHTLLSNRMRPPRHVPTHTIPSLLSANSVARSQALLLAHHLGGNTLAEAESLALRAVEVCEAGIKMSLSPTGELKAVRTATGRNEWRSVRALREGLMMLLRVRMRKGVVESGGGLVGRVWEMTGRDWGREVDWWVGEIRGDGAWELAKGEEEEGWRVVRGA